MYEKNSQTIMLLFWNKQKDYITQSPTDIPIVGAYVVNHYFFNSYCIL